MAVTVYVKLKLKRLNNRLNIRELNSAKVKDFKRGRGNYPVKTYRVRAAETVDIRLNRLNKRLANRLNNRLNWLSDNVGTTVTVNVRITSVKLNDFKRGRGSYPVEIYRDRTAVTVNESIRLSRLKNRLNKLSIRFNSLNNMLNRLSISVRTAVTLNVRLNRLNNSLNRDVRNRKYLVKTYRIRTAVTVNIIRRNNRLNANFKNLKNVKKGREAVWEILIPILQHFFHFFHIIFDF